MEKKQQNRLFEYHGINYNSNRSFGTLHKLYEIVELKHGKILDDYYKSVENSYNFKCEHNHTFKLRASAIIYRNRWCPECRHGPKLEDYIKSNGGELISNINNVCIVKCKHNHTFSYVSKYMIHQKRWCKKCEYIDKYGYFPQNLYDKMLELSKDKEEIQVILKSIFKNDKERQLFILGSIFNTGIALKLWDEYLLDYY